ncbi:fez family zinc finger protein erm-like [Myripristis murdjan]|uniref:fez family zinc finger protein erm-like n=1 Tax=Myripristis murdjan TaxID=586833 RepID=UPI001175F1BF|nr:fez family zinc finger protein erm-like [Myripristis murdjan]
MERPAGQPQAGEGGLRRTGGKEWREVGCQSDAAERRDAAVQVDLLNPTARHVVMWQCVDVTANRPAGGALNTALTSAHRPVPTTVTKPVSPHWTPLNAPRPAATAAAAAALEPSACRKKILVLNKGGGRRVLLVMDSAHLQTASPAAAAGAPAVRAEVAKRPSLQVAPRVRAAATTPQTKEAASRRFPQSLSVQHISSAAPRLSRPPNPNLAVTAGRPPEATRDNLNPAQSSPPSAPPPGRNKILVMSVAGRQVLLVMNASQQLPPLLQHHPTAAATATATATNQSHLSPQPSADHRPLRDRLAPGAPSLPAAPPPYVCEFCGLRYASVATLRQHRRHIHGAAGVFICRVCGKGLSCRRQLAHHSLLHRGHKLYWCRLCARSFSHLGPLRQHRRRLHRHSCHGGSH